MSLGDSGRTGVPVEDILLIGCAEGAALGPLAQVTGVFQDDGVPLIITALGAPIFVYNDGYPLLYRLTEQRCCCQSPTHRSSSNRAGPPGGKGRKKDLKILPKGSCRIP